MPRRVQRPSFPDTPGKWLACYRYRWQPDGKVCSPEQLGVVLGVSGTTVRRWEAGQLRPTREDIARFARTCDLTSLEEAFLMEAFQTRAAETPPAHEAFTRLAETVLASETPAFLMDSLFNIRARNTYMKGISSRDLTPATSNALLGVYGPQRVPTSNSILDVVRGFWFATAPLNGLPPFRRLLASLRDLDGFEDAWWHIALTSEGAEVAHNLPAKLSHAEHGTYRVYMTRVTAPPVYFLREYVPLDDTAIAYVRSLRAAGPNGIEMNGPHHWALDE